MIKYTHATELDFNDIGWVPAEGIFEITKLHPACANDFGCRLISMVVVFDDGAKKIDITSMLRSHVVEDVEREALASFLSYSKPDPAALAKSANIEKDVG